MSKPLLDKCANRKDFGKGFYLTSSREQAESFIKTSIVKAINNGDANPDQNYGVISVYKVELSRELKCHIFKTANEEWLHCIAAHRKRRSFVGIEEEMMQYDIIAGKIADDQTNTTLAAYIAGAFGTMGEKEADEFCIRQLLPERLEDQFCFKTERALDCLHFVEGERIWLQK